MKNLKQFCTLMFVFCSSCVCVWSQQFIKPKSIFPTGSYSDISQDKTTILTSSYSGFTVHDIPNNSYTTILSEFGRDLICSDLSADGNYVAALSPIQGGSNTDYDLTLWNTKSKATIFVKRIKTQGYGALKAIYISRDNKYIIILQGGVLGIYNFSDGSLTKSFYKGEVWSVSFSTDMKFMAVVKENTNIAIWNTETWLMHGNIITKGEVQNVFCFSPDNSKLAVGTNRKIDIWDVKTMKLISKVGNYEQASVEFSSDGKILIVPNFYSVIFWDIDEGKEVRKLKFSTLIVSVSLREDNNQLLIIDHNNKMIIADAITGQIAYEFNNFIVNYKDIRSGSDTLVVFSRDPIQKIQLMSIGKSSLKNIKTIFSFSHNNYNLIKVSEHNKMLIENGEMISIVTFNDEMNKILTIENINRGQLRLLLGKIALVDVSSFSNIQYVVWDIEKNKQLWEFYGQMSGESFMDVSEDGNKIVIMHNNDTGDRIAEIYNTETQELIFSSENITQPIRPLREAILNKNESEIILFEQDSKGFSINSWDIATEKKMNEIMSDTGDIRLHYPSNDANKIIIIRQNRYISVWDDAAQRITYNLDLGQQQFDDYEYLFTALDNDSKKLTTFGYDHKVVLWNLSSGSKIAELELDQNTNNVQFNPDNSTLLIISEYGKGYVWDINNSTLARTFIGHNSPFRSMHCISDTKSLISQGKTGEVIVWNLEEATSNIPQTEETIHTVNFFPNPADKEITLVWSNSTDKNIPYEITNMMGEKMFSGVIFPEQNTISFPTQNFPSGIYACIYNKNEKLIHENFIVQH